MNHHEDWMDRHQEGGGEMERTSKTPGYRAAEKKYKKAKHTANHPRPLSKIAERKGKGSQLHNVVNGWATSLKSPHEKALDKSIRRHENKAK